VNRDSIQTEYDRGGYGLGWRFMMSPEASFGTATLAVVGLNPGGSRAHGTDWSYEEGNAYWRESWGGQPNGCAPLQRQVQGLAALLGRTEANTFAAQFVPFRSPSWDALPNRWAAEQFAENLWSSLLATPGPALYVCLGKAVVGPAIARILGATFESSHLVGWGNQTADRYVSQRGCVVVALPHLGRFKLIGRPQSESAILEAARPVVPT
jgi:hypothetical protein